MRQLFLTCFCTFLLINTYGQQNIYFSKFGTQISTMAANFTIGYNGDIILSGGTFSYNSNNASLFIARLDTTGTLIRIKEIKDSFPYVSYIGTGIHDSGYYFLSQKFFLHDPYKTSFSILITDTALNVYQEVFVPYNDTMRIHGGYAIIDSRGDFISCGRLAKPSGSTLPYLVKIDLDGNIKNHQFDTFPGYQFGLNTKIIEDFNANGYFLGSQNKSKGGGERILHIDSHFNILSDTIRFPHYMHWVCGLKRQNPDRLIISTNTTNNGNLAIAAFDTLGRMIHFLERTQPGYYIMEGVDPIAVTDSSIFFASYHTLLGNVLFPPINNYITVQKLDTSFQVLWETELGWDAYFIYSNIHPTPDGGCLVLASVYDSDTMYMRHDVVLFKIDIDGNIIGINTINSETGVFKLFPNPGSNYFNIEVLSQEKWVKVFDLNGRLIKKEYLNEGLNRIDMQKASSGVYIIKTIDNLGKNIRSTKWIKN